MTFLLVTMKPKKISQKENQIQITHHTSIERGLSHLCHQFLKVTYGLDELIEHYLDEIYESSDEEIEFAFMRFWKSSSSRKGNLYR